MLTAAARTLSGAGGTVNHYIKNTSGCDRDMQLEDAGLDKAKERYAPSAGVLITMFWLDRPSPFLVREDIRKMYSLLSSSLSKLN